MSAITAKAAMKELAAKAAAVVADETKSNEDKRTELDKLEVDLKKYSDEVALHEQSKRFMVGGEAADDAKADDPETKHVALQAIGRQIVESDGYKSMLNGQSKGVSVEVKTVNTIDEGIMATYSGGAGQGGQLAVPQFLPGIVPLKFQPLTIADLVAQGTTSNNAITYVIEAAFQDTTAAVLEKGTKPQLDLTLARRQDNVSKIANVAKVTDEMFQDVNEFQSYLSNRMMFGVRRTEEAEILSGSGTAPHLQGIMNRSGLATTVVTAAGLTALKAIEGIYNQITALRSTSFVEPDAIVINPTDWQTIRLGKDNQNQYYGGGPFTGAYGNPGPANVSELWGLRVVVTSAMPQGTVLVGGFQECAQIFRRQGITLEMTNSNVDDFVNNLITLRAEERLALAVYRPAGFGKVTLTA